MQDASEKLKSAYEQLHRKTKYVFSKTKTGDESNTIFINSNIKEYVEELLKQPGKNIWLYGGGKLVTTFLNLSLVDVFRLAVHPVILGKGKPLFNDINERHHLHLKEIKGHESGVVLLTYERT